MKISKIALTALMLVVLAACGEAKPAAPASGGSTGAAPKPASSGADLTVGTGSAFEFKFAETTLQAAAGEVKLTLKNASRQPHNWTLVKVGEEAKADASATTAGAPEYKSAEAVAQTETIDGGQSTTISFKAEPGTYSYICTVPGHFHAGMKGTLVVK